MKKNIIKVIVTICILLFIGGLMYFFSSSSELIIIAKCIIEKSEKFDLFFDVEGLIITISNNQKSDNGLIMYESLDDKTPMMKLKAEDLQFMDNISISWIDPEVTKSNGSHNGENYIAYSFYVENKKSTESNYSYKIKMSDVIKNIDEALRVMIYVNDDVKVYAKGNSISGEAEPLYYINSKNKDKKLPYTTKFREDKDGTIIIESRKGMESGSIDKLTIVIWIEGDDPECTDALVGQPPRLHMELIEK